MANPVERNPQYSNLSKFEQKYFQKLRILGPENHFEALRSIKMTVPGVFPINIQFIKRIHANGLMKSWPPHSALHMRMAQVAWNLFWVVSWTQSQHPLSVLGWFMTSHDVVHFALLIVPIGFKANLFTFFVLNLYWSFANLYQTELDLDAAQACLAPTSGDVVIGGVCCEEIYRNGKNISLMKILSCILMENLFLYV